MLVESIVRKTLGLKRHCIKKVTEEHGEIVVYLFPDGRCRLICSCPDTGTKLPRSTIWYPLQFAPT